MEINCVSGEDRKHATVVKGCCVPPLLAPPGNITALSKLLYTVGGGIFCESVVVFHVQGASCCGAQYYMRVTLVYYEGLIMQ